MPKVSSQENELRDEQESTKRQERANRILDAAAELTIRPGYAKTTIDDIAKQAGVAKGTIYLHWKTRDELFTALLQREQMAVARDIQQRMAVDPEGGTLHGMNRHRGYAVMSSQLMKALFLRDTDVPGELARLKQNTIYNRSRRTLNYCGITGLCVPIYVLKNSCTCSVRLQQAF